MRSMLASSLVSAALAVSPATGWAHDHHDHDGDDDDHHHHHHDDDGDADANDPGIDEFALILRTREDPNAPPDMTVCQKAPFPVTVALGGSVYASLINPLTGEVLKSFAHKVGTATACMLVTNPAFPAWSKVPVYATFVLDSGTYTGLGQCDVVSNSTPEAGLVLAGCTAALTSFPDDVIGGMASTSTLINAAKVPGYETGSVVTIRGWKVRP